MSSQSTDHATLADQQAAFAALFALAWVAPQLPAPFVCIHTFAPIELDVTPQSLDGFEQWRQALKADPQNVELHAYDGGGNCLAVSSQFNGVAVKLSTHFVLATQADALEAAAAVSV